MFCFLIVTTLGQCKISKKNKHISLPFPAFGKIGGYHNLEEAYLKAVPSKIIPNATCHLPRPDAMHLFRDPASGDLPWTGMTFGLSVLAMWYWCTDQVNINTTAPSPH